MVYGRLLVGTCLLRKERDESLPRSVLGARRGGATQLAQLDYVAKLPPPNELRYVFVYSIPVLCESRLF